MTATTDPAAEVVDLLRELRLPHMSKTATDLLASGKAQRWEPAEAVWALLAEELTGRQQSSISIRRNAAGFPTGKTFDAWDDTISSIPAPTLRSSRTLEWIGRHETWSCADHPGPAKATSSKQSARSPSRLVITSAGSASSAAI